MSNIKDFEIEGFDFNEEMFEIDNNIQEQEQEIPAEQENKAEDTLPEQLSHEEELVNLWLENNLLMIDPDQDEISSLEDVLKLDAERRTEYVKNAIIDRFPDKFKMLANAVINDGIEDIDSILSLMNTNNKENVAISPEDAIRNHWKELGLDDDIIDMDIETLRENNKLEFAAQKLIEREQKQQERERELIIKNEIEKQKIQREQEERQRLEHANYISNQIDTKPWNSEVKRIVKEEYFTGQTFEKIRQLATNPDTAAELAMLISRIYEQDKDRVKLNMSSLVDIVKGQEGKKLKEAWGDKTLKGGKIRFGQVRKPEENSYLDDYEF